MRTKAAKAPSYYGHREFTWENAAKARQQFCFNHATSVYDSSVGQKGEHIWRNRGELGRARGGKGVPSVSSSRAEFVLVTETSRQTGGLSLKRFYKGLQVETQWLQSPASFRISTGLIVERVWRGALGLLSTQSLSTLSSPPAISDYFR